MRNLIRFSLSGMTSEQYKSVGRKLGEAGHWPAEGPVAHVCFGASGMSEVWESGEKQEQFAQKLMPVLQEEDVDLSGEPGHPRGRGYLMREASGESGDWHGASIMTPTKTPVAGPALT
jgi:hypothetical protein